jgi:hypothetical protein
MEEAGPGLGGEHECADPLAVECMECSGEIRLGDGRRAVWGEKWDLTGGPRKEMELRRKVGRRRSEREDRVHYGMTLFGRDLFSDRKWKKREKHLPNEA